MAKPTDYVHEVFVPMPGLEEAREIIGPGFDADKLLNVLRMFAGAEEMYPALIGMVRGIFGVSDIDARRREIIILRAAVIFNCPYEWQANEQMARNAGLTDLEITAVTADGPVTGIAPDYLLLCAAADEMYGRHTLTDATLKQLLQTFGTALTRKYIVTLGWFSMLSLILNACRVPLETTDKIGRRTSPLG